MKKIKLKDSLPEYFKIKEKVDRSLDNLQKKDRN